MTIPYDPYGVNPKKGLIQDTIYRFYQGDTLELRLKAAYKDDTAVDTSDTLEFTLVNKRYDHEVIWTGDNTKGVAVLKPGVVDVTVPPEIADKLRRGSFMFSLRASKELGVPTETVATGTILIEYGADAPTPTVGYKYET